MNRNLKQKKELKAEKLIIESDLREKELLLKEIHHRVKNNFQIISSLIDLKSNILTKENALNDSFFNDIKGRIKSMSIIHQKLHENSNSLGKLTLKTI